MGGPLDFLGGGSGDTSSSTELPGWQRKRVEAGLKGADQLWKGGGPEMYEGDILADESSYTTQSRQMALDQADSFFPGMQSDFDTMNQYATNPMMNQDFRGQLDYGNNRIMDVMNKGTAFGGLDATAAGQFGGSRQGVAQALMGESAQREMKNFNDKMMGSARQQGMNFMAQTAPFQSQLAMTPSNIYGEVGNQETAREQDLINADRERWDFNQNREEAAVDKYLDRVGGGRWGRQASGTTGAGNEAMGGIMSLLGKGAGALGNAQGNGSIFDFSSWGGGADGDMGEAFDVFNSSADYWGGEGL